MVDMEESLSLAPPGGVAKASKHTSLVDCDQLASLHWGEDSSILREVEFPTLSAAATVPKSKKGHRKQKPSILNVFGTEALPEQTPSLATHQIPEQTAGQSTDLPEASETRCTTLGPERIATPSPSTVPRFSPHVVHDMPRFSISARDLGHNSTACDSRSTALPRHNTDLIDLQNLLGFQNQVPRAMSEPISTVGHPEASSDYGTSSTSSRHEVWVPCAPKAMRGRLGARDYITLEETLSRSASEGACREAMTSRGSDASLNPRANDFPGISGDMIFPEILAQPPKPRSVPPLGLRESRPVPAIQHHSFCTVDPTNSSLEPSSKKSFNVDSPSFTPAPLGNKKSNFSTNAAPFTPRGASTPASNSTLQPEAASSVYKSGPFPDFTPQNNYDLNTTVSPDLYDPGQNQITDQIQTTVNGSTDSSSLGYDPFTMSNVTQALQSSQYNPYAEDHNPLAGTGTPFYSPQTAYSAPSQPLQYHLYYPIASARENLQPYQRQVYDFFVSETIREDLQKKSEASRQVLASQPGVQLPSLQQYHSLVPLDTRIRSAATVFGLPTWVWKATSRKNGNIYCLRRIEGFRLTNEEAIKAVNSWKKITHPNIVTTVEAFTTRDFNDSSLIFVHNYHPLSKTLAEHHFPSTRYGRIPVVPEKVLWGYLVQLASALKTIHRAKLAARSVDISKVILTDKNRVRLAACSIFDVLQFEAHRRIDELQQEDLFNLGKLILSIATNTQPKNLQDLRVLLEQMGRQYSPELKERIAWLLSPPQPQMAKTADQLVFELAQHVDDLLVATSNAEDELANALGKELENGRLVRLLAKLGTINERPEHDGDPNWSETDARYTLKLYRDYLFHQVDSQGNPVLDLGHVIGSLNKLDAGVDEKIYLTSRDSQSAFLVSYKELKKQVQTAFTELLRR
ncbi:hypothetical protein F5Y15DRAFT_83515 [Xylariaceae sp. FL0016]|nr:hypothetical protein F5Y15DRAFT_83515 [Xylariaceae sp. FL0016]